MIFFSGSAGAWLRLSEKEKKQLVGAAMVIQKQKTASRKEKTA